MFADALNTESFRFPRPVEGGLAWVQGDYRPVQHELRRFVQAWRVSGPNVSKLFSGDTVLERASWRLSAHMIPTEGPRARLAYVTVPDNLPPGSPLEIAIGLFLQMKSSGGHADVAANIM
jgi:hypothetical protein